MESVSLPVFCLDFLWFLKCLLYFPSTSESMCLWWYCKHIFFKLYLYFTVNVSHEISCDPVFPMLVLVSWINVEMFNSSCWNAPSGPALCCKSKDAYEEHDLVFYRITELYLCFGEILKSLCNGVCIYFDIVGDEQSCSDLWKPESGVSQLEQLWVSHLSAHNLATTKL